MQFALTFNEPSSNHRTCRSSGFQETSFTFENGLIQSTLRACSRQNPSGSLSECSYIESYLERSTWARSRHSTETGMTSSAIVQTSATLRFSILPTLPGTSGASCPGLGGRRRMAAGVLEKWIGGLLARHPPSVGWEINV